MPHPERQKQTSRRSRPSGKSQSSPHLVSDRALGSQISGSVEPKTSDSNLPGDRRRRSRLVALLREAAPGPSGNQRKRAVGRCTFVLSAPPAPPIKSVPASDPSVLLHIDAGTDSSMPTQTNEASDFEFIIHLIYERCRIRLHDGKQQLIKARLAKRMRHHGFETLGQYCDYLRRTNDEGELTHMVDALTTNYTHFLREKDHFEFLVGTALPGLLNGRRKFQVWSAACATGEEPYSIGFYLSEHFPLHGGWDWRVQASDISTKALSKAQQAVYAEERLESLPADWWRKYFQKGQRDWEGHYRVKPALQERLTFKQVNLLGNYTFAEPFEVIFCRNVMIYFDRATQEQLVRRLAQFLVPKGYLLIGHSESLNGLDIGLRCLRPSIYQKT